MGEEKGVGYPARWVCRGVPGALAVEVLEFFVSEVDQRLLDNQSLLLAE